MRTALIAAAVAIAAGALAASALASPTTTIVIRHQVHGCHAWAVGASAFKPSQSVRVARGTTFALTNDDVMPHTLVQLSGPRVSLGQPKLGHMGASTRFTLLRPGTYRFGTKAGEDYPGMGEPETIGKDNVLRLTVVVK